MRVPFTEVTVDDGAARVLLYDTSGPGSAPETGLAPLRSGWITGRGDVVERTTAGCHSCATTAGRRRAGAGRRRRTPATACARSWPAARHR